MRRQRDRIAGRIAAKRALHTLTGVDPLTIDIPRAESGEPVARVPGHPAVTVSLSHTDGDGIALAARSGRVGLDRERIEARPDSFLQMWFSEQERALAVDAVTQNLIWSAKEAVLKALGTGMAIAPRHVHVEALRPRALRVRLDGPAAERLEEIGGSLALVWSREEGFVLVLARIL